MEQPEPAALTSALLVRKGEAAPTYYAAPPPTLTFDPARNRAAGGFSLRGLWSRITTRRNSHVIPVTVNAPVAARRKRPKEGRMRLTVRVDQRRNLQLRIAAAHRNESLQTVMLEAVDRYLDHIGGSLANGQCACLESQLEKPACGSAKSAACAAQHREQDDVVAAVM